MSDRRPATRCTMRYLRTTHVAKIDHGQGAVWDWWCGLCDYGAPDENNSLTWDEALSLAHGHALIHALTSLPKNTL